MSVVEYLRLLDQCSKEIVWQSEREWLKLIYGRFIPDGSVDDITDVITLLNKLEEKNLLGIDRLKVLKELLKGIRKWDLLRILERFEMKRKEYRQLLEQISHALEESNELQRLILICRRKNLVAHEREEHIKNVDALFAELEQQHELGIEDLTILKTIATEMEKPDLCRLVEEFEKKRKQEEDAERWDDNIRRAGAQAASVLSGGINIGERLIGVVTPYCTFRNLAGGAVVVTTWMVLRRSPSMVEFVSAFKEAVLPLGNCLCAISEGSIRFTIQAESMSALKALWQSYQDKTLQTNLQEFLVTEEIKQLAGGEVTLTVHISKDEYRNALWDLMVSEREELTGKEKGGLKHRARSDSDLSRMQGVDSENGKDLVHVGEFMSYERKIRVEEFLGDLPENQSTISRTADSGVGTWSCAFTESRSKEGAEESRHEKLNHTEALLTDAIEILDCALSDLRETSSTEAVLKSSVTAAKRKLENSREKIYTWQESREEIPGGEEWKIVADGLGLTPREIRFLDQRTLNPMEAVLGFVGQKSSVRVETLYDLMTELGLPEAADLFADAALGGSITKAYLNDKDKEGGNGNIGPPSLMQGTGNQDITE
nr:uncharacterized protein LOC131793263 [Pocillopora verrucosa]